MSWIAKYFICCALHHSFGYNKLAVSATSYSTDNLSYPPCSAEFSRRLKIVVHLVLFLLSITLPIFMCKASSNIRQPVTPVCRVRAVRRRRREGLLPATKRAERRQVCWRRSVCPSCPCFLAPN
jgi:hypothetical protein